ncbi:hypothetical protein F4678DRAFT_466293 [Xylaria arbuscula]|nr:hypothetical protein F4678DRAFT_466293 [Xylaria arbuscula]
MSTSSPHRLARESQNENALSIKDGYEFEKRWPRRRGKYEIETQCSKCRWWFDSFDPSANACGKCLNSLPVNGTETPDSLIPIPLDEVSQTVPNSSPWFGTEVENVQSARFEDPGGSSTQYQTNGQDFGITANHPRFPGIISSPPVECMPDQLWGQEYDMFPYLSDSAGISSTFEEYTQNQTYEQGYSMPPSLSYYPTTAPNSSEMYTANRTVMREPSSSSHLSLYSEITLNPPLDNTPSQPGQKFVDHGVNTTAQGPIRRTSLKNAGSTAPYLRPLRPLLPREPSPDESPSTTTTTQLHHDNHKRQSGNKAPARRRGSSSTTTSPRNQSPKSYRPIARKP